VRKSTTINLNSGGGSTQLASWHDTPAAETDLSQSRVGLRAKITAPLIADGGFAQGLVVWWARELMSSEADGLRGCAIRTATCAKKVHEDGNVDVGTLLSQRDRRLGSESVAVQRQRKRCGPRNFCSVQGKLCKDPPTAKGG
jgi:hypothetical protein